MTPFYWIDSFASVPYEGNPAGVCILESKLDDLRMQNIAKEINLSETAFVVPNGNHFDLRWFTPKIEVDLCGHATLASAHALWESGKVNVEESIQFHTKSGVLTAKKTGDFIFVDFPAFKVSPVVVPPAYLLDGLGIEIASIGRTDTTLLVEVDSEERLRAINPDFEFLEKVPYMGIIVTSVSGSKEYDFVSRYFGPREGINEDPVTGFAHCHLGPYWQSRLGKSEFNAYQASQRGGFLKVSVVGDRVHLGGQAITFLKGSLIGVD